MAQLLRELAAWVNLWDSWKHEPERLKEHWTFDLNPALRPLWRVQVIRTIWPGHSYGLGQQSVRCWAFDGRHAYLPRHPVVCLPIGLWYFHKSDGWLNHSATHKSLTAWWLLLELLTWLWGSLDIQHKNRRPKKEAVVHKSGWKQR